MARLMADRLAHSATPDLIGAWCEYAGTPRGRSMGPGALINAIRYGDPPPSRSRPGQNRGNELERITEWIRQNLPELCDPDGVPHMKALATVMLLEHRHGKERLSAAEHGPAVRRAVERFEAEICGEAAQSSPPVHAPTAGGKDGSSAAPPDRPVSRSAVDMSQRTQQRHSALDRANEIRLARAELKAKIASGEIFAASVLLDPPVEARTWQTGDLLTAQRRWGPRRMRKLLTSLMISEIKPLEELTERQRRMLADRLPQSERTSGSEGEGRGTDGSDGRPGAGGRDLASLDESGGEGKP